MKNYIWGVIIGILIFCVSSCETVKLDPAANKSIKNIGVVSIVGNEVEIYKKKSVKLMFSSYKELYLKQDAGLNMNYISDEIARKLIGNYSIRTAVKLDYEYEKMKGVYSSSAFTNEISTSGYESYIKQITLGKNLDALLVISKCNCSDIIGGNSNDMVSGYGLYSKYWGTDDMQYATFSAIRLTLIDLNTFKIVASERNVNYRYYKDAAMWTADLKSLDDNNKKLILDTLIKHLTNSMGIILSTWKIIEPKKS